MGEFCGPKAKGKGGFGVLGKPDCIDNDKYHEPVDTWMLMWRSMTRERAQGEEFVQTHDPHHLGVGGGHYVRSKEEFLKYATEFERQYSVLTQRPKGRLEANAWDAITYKANPVVESKDNLIVGHYGWFRADRIWVPNSAPKFLGEGELAYRLELRDLVNQGVTVLIRSSYNPPPDSSAWGADGEKYRCLTDVDGRVLQITNYGVVGLQSVEEVFLFISVGYAVGKVVGKAAVEGVKLGFKTLKRKFGKEAIKRPALPKGIINGHPPSTFVGRLIEPASVIGLVEIQGKSVVYRVNWISFQAHTAEELARVPIARLAHREMVVNSAREAKKLGQKQFIVRGIDAQAGFPIHANKLAKELGVPNSGKWIPGSDSRSGMKSYEVILDVAKVLKSQ